MNSSSAMFQMAIDRETGSQTVPVLVRIGAGGDSYSIQCRRDP